MRVRLSRFALIVLAGLALHAAAGCSSIQSWAQFGSNHPPRAGASVSVPLGK